MARGEGARPPTIKQSEDPSTNRRAPIASWLAAHPGEVRWGLVVAGVYAILTLILGLGSSVTISRAMTLAIHFSQGRLDLGGPVGATDTLTIQGATYWVVGPLTFLPYLPFVPFPGLWAASDWIVSAAFGIAAGWMMLPFARRFGPDGHATWWLATFGAFGTLLFSESIRGNDYYLAHAEAMLFTVIALIEWQGRRRSWLIGLALGLAGLARPPVFLAVIPFGLALGWGAPRAMRRMAEFAAPVSLSIAVAALYNALRFGSPIETGYGIAALTNAALARSRLLGVFSIRHVPENLELLLFNGFGYQAGFPYLVPDPNGHSILLTSPALLSAVGAGIRSRTTAALWSAAGLITILLMLYYGGGGRVTYGYRYFLDATPFLLALTALAAQRHFGSLERLLIVMSVGFVSYGFIWAAFGL
jgi:hypothetical protein